MIICSRSRQHGLTRSLVDFRGANGEGDKVVEVVSPTVKSCWAAGSGLDSLCGGYVVLVHRVDNKD